MGLDASYSATVKRGNELASIHFDSSMSNFITGRDVRNFIDVAEDLHYGLIQSLPEHDDKAFKVEWDFDDYWNGQEASNWGAIPEWEPDGYTVYSDDCMKKSLTVYHTKGFDSVKFLNYLKANVSYGIEITKKHTN